MRFFFLILFSVVVCIQSLQGFFTILNWKINQTEITEKFCENKAKPILKCNGKCHLMKQLKLQEEEKEVLSKTSKKPLSKFKKLKGIELFNETDFTLFSLNPLNDIQEKPISTVILNYNYEEINLCFQPPQFS